MSATGYGEADVVARVREDQAAGRRVVFTNGAFDLFHAGHLGLLQAAAAEGDVLVVGINSDETVRRAKGPRRPVVPVLDRARIVAALACVDHVLVFDDTTVDRLLEVLRPDVHAKGADYDDGTLPERETNARLGISMRFVGPPKERASSSVMARAAAAGAPAADRVLPLGDPDDEGYVNRRVRARLLAEGWLDLQRLQDTDHGEIVFRQGGLTRRRLEMAGVPVLLETTLPFEKSASPILEFQNHLAVRAVGLGAPEPWLAIEGTGRAGALVTREEPGIPLDRFAAERLGSLSPAAQRRAAKGVGRALRAFHTARLVSPEARSCDWVVRSDAADGDLGLALCALKHLERPSGRVGPRQGARSLAVLAESLRPHVTDGLLLAALRAYLGGSLRASKAWLERIDRQRAKRS